MFSPLGDVAVIVPALNESASLPGVLRDLPAGPRVVVVDNGSEDDTAALATALGATVLHEPRRGYGSAVQAGIRYLLDRPPAIAVVLDADHADDPARLPSLVEPIASGRYDMVLADRTLTAEPGALNLTQRLGNGLAVRLIARATGHRYRDMGPFRAIRFDRLVQMRLRDPTWGWNVEMQMRAVQHGLRILELPLPYRCRRAGTSKISGTVSGAARAGFRILTAVHRYR